MDRIKLRVRSEDLDRASRKASEESKALFADLVGYIGLGERPETRRRFYAYLVKVSRHHGDRATFLIRKVMHRAKKKNDPGKWFATVIVEELDKRMMRDILDESSDVLS